jgi:hypothetical protein
MKENGMKFRCEIARFCSMCSANKDSKSLRGEISCDHKAGGGLTFRDVESRLNWLIYKVLN